MKFFAILTTLIVLFGETLPAEEAEENTFCSTRKREESQCGFHTYNVVKPLLDYFRKVQHKLDNQDNIVELQVQVAERDNTIELYKKLNDSSAAQIDLLNENVRLLKSNRQPAQNESDVVADLTRTIAAQSKTIKDQSRQIRELRELSSTASARYLSGRRAELAACKKINLDNQLEGCASVPGFYKIKLHGYSPFTVRCENITAGPGGIVIQQRKNGKEDFYRNWDDYRNGFGTLNENFFLGLESIHQLTATRRFKLGIRVKDFIGEFAVETYDDFAIAGESDQYELIRLGKHSGLSTTIACDCLKDDKDNKFYTFDRDNSDGHAKKFHGGWWYGGLTKSNLNGNYSDNGVKSFTSLFWRDIHIIKGVQMVIQPID